MSLPDYAGLTRDDPNPLKRWLQRRRLDDALAMAPADCSPRVVVDYGAGDGELARRLAARFPAARVIAFEPAAEFAAAARAGGGRVEVVETEAELPDAADLVVCCEVFEHLPEREEAIALDQIGELVGRGGRLLVGVPIEVGPPALAKGLFRMARRAGQEDARWPGVWRAATGRGQPHRAVSEIAGRAYHPSHLGFDHRALRRRLSLRFDILATRSSPAALVPTWVNAELYWWARRKPPI